MMDMSQGRPILTPEMTHDLNPHAGLNPGARVTVWFDGGCILCRNEIALYQALDRRVGRVSFVELGAGTDPAACPLDPGELLARFHARDEHGNLVSGAVAFGALWRHVTPFQPLGHLMRVGLVARAAEWAYRRFLRIRPQLQAWLTARMAARNP
jgi:predicted DCC family thiol-disulfide oxidoreductase YuxK